VNDPKSRRSRTSTLVRFVLRAGRTVVTLIALYALGSIAALPWVVDWAMDRFAESGPERSARVARTYINPFTLDLVLQGLEVSDLRVDVSFAAGLVRLDLSAVSVLERRPVLDSVVIERAALQVGLRQVGALVRELQGPLAPRVERLELRAGSVQTNDFADSAGRELTLSDISVTATGLDLQLGGEAQADTSRYALHAAAPGGAEIDLEGSLMMGLQRALGRITVRNLDLDTIRPWFGAQLEALAPQGIAEWAAEYALTSLLTTPQLEVLDAGGELIDFSFSPVPDITVSASRLSGTASGSLSREQGAVTHQGRVGILDAAFELVDARLAPPETFAFSEVAVAIAADSRAQQLTIDTQGRVGDQGSGSLTMEVLSERDPSATFAIELTDIPAALLSPYTEQQLGRALDDGRADVALNYARGAEGVDGNLSVIARDLSLSVVAPELGSADDRSLDLAAALLEDAQGVIQIDVEFTAGAGSVEDAAGNALEGQLVALAATPFAELGGIVDRDADELRAVSFEAGTAALDANSLDTIDALAVALRERPRLGMQVPPGFDPVIDRDALARQQIELHVLLATAGVAGGARPQSLDFASPRARGVLSEFANERLTPGQADSIAMRFECGAEVACPGGYYVALFDALVASEPISEAALDRLGRFRAQSITAALEERGIEPERVELITDAAVAGGPSPVVVPIEVRVNRPQ